MQINVGSRCTLSKHLSNPKKANLTSTPLKNIEKLVEASTCALGSQPQKGHMGNLTPKPNIKHTNIKLTSKEEIKVLAILEKDDSPVKKNR